MFLDNLKNIMNNKNIKKAELAKKINVSKAIFTQWEKGSSPKFETVIKIAEELNVSLDYLAYGEEKQYKSKLDMLYEKASEEDKQIVNLALAKYKEMGKSSNTKIG